MRTGSVLITGAARGIGRAVAAFYSDQGWHVFAPTRAELDLSSVNRVNEWISSGPPPVDVLINNAGVNEAAKAAAELLERMNGRNAANDKQGKPRATELDLEISTQSPLAFWERIRALRFCLAGHTCHLLLVYSSSISLSSQSHNAPYLHRNSVLQ